MTGSGTPQEAPPAVATRRAWLGLGMLAVLLAGCGRKGDLYLPRDARRPREAGEEEPSPDDIVPEDYDDR